MWYILYNNQRGNVNPEAIPVVFSVWSGKVINAHNGKG